jgi:hypothetical protein
LEEEQFSIFLYKCRYPLEEEQFSEKVYITESPWADPYGYG